MDARDEQPCSSTDQTPRSTPENDQNGIKAPYKFDTIDEKRLFKIGTDSTMEYLKVTRIPRRMYPIRGRIVDNEKLAPLYCQHPDQPEYGIIVWFIVVPGAPFTYISEKALNAARVDCETIWGTYWLVLHGTMFETRKSYGTFEDLNILGDDALTKLKLNGTIVEDYYFNLTRKNI